VTSPSAPTQIRQLCGHRPAAPESTTSAIPALRASARNAATVGVQYLIRMSAKAAWPRGLGGPRRGLPYSLPVFAWFILLLPVHRLPVAVTALRCRL